MTWPTKRQWQRQIQRQRQWQRQIHLENTFKERLLRLVTFETFDQSDEGTWPDLTKDKNKDKGNYKDNDIDNPRDLSHLRHWSQFWQLRTWFHNNLCCLTIKSDTGQHSQFLRCFGCTNYKISYILYIILCVWLLWFLGHRCKHMSVHKIWMGFKTVRLLILAA